KDQSPVKSIDIKLRVAVILVGQDEQVRKVHAVYGELKFLCHQQVHNAERYRISLARFQYDIDHRISGRMKILGVGAEFLFTEQHAIDDLHLVERVKIGLKFQPRFVIDLFQILPEFQ